MSGESQSSESSSKELFREVRQQEGQCAGRRWRRQAQEAGREVAAVSRLWPIPEGRHVSSG